MARASVITELKSTLFTTPVISTLGRWLSLFLLKLTGWKIEGVKPPDVKCIVIAAPHTSNWDFILFILAAFATGFNAHWMGKDSLFKFPFHRLMIWLGGIPIDRSKSHNVIDQMVDYFNSVDELTLLITPEGTRSKVERWKTGFYHIAKNGNVPLYLGYLDASRKCAGFGQRFQLSADLDGDMEKILAFYRDKKGIREENH